MSEQKDRVEQPFLIRRAELIADNGGRNGRSKPLDLAAVRKRLEQRGAKEAWRSIEEIADTKEFQEFIEREFPRHAAPWAAALDRRQFLKLMAASLALAGLTACRQRPIEKIVPYVNAPEEIIPGIPLYYASALTLGGFATGVLVESHTGRPTKIEGNPEHPASLGSTDAFLQAMILGLYDPDRSQEVLNNGQPGTWDGFLSEVRTELARQKALGGPALRVLTETVTSPTLAAQLRSLLAEFPSAKWHQYEPVNRDNVRAGARLAFGEDAEPIYRFDRADVVLSLDADFLSVGPGRVRYTRDFSDRRRVRADKKEMNRLYAVESTPTVTGGMADHRLPIQARDVELFARALAARLDLLTVDDGSAFEDAHRNWLDAMARDLLQQRGSSLVVAGDHQPPVVHALAHAINDALGNVGRTVVYLNPVEANPQSQTESLRELVRDMRAEKVDTLLILGGNPVFNSPADLEFGKAIKSVNFAVHLSLYDDETSALCRWHIPMAHELEAWGDARAYDGTVSIIQPLIEPLLGGKSAHELLAAVQGQPDDGLEIVREHWRTRTGDTDQSETTSEEPRQDFDKTWRKWLHDGLIPDTAEGAIQVSLRPDWATAIGAPPASAGGLEVVFKPDAGSWDGRFANNAWLQELPKPLTSLTWDNVAALSPQTAQDLHLVPETGSGQGTTAPLIDLHVGGRTLKNVPVWIMPGHADNCLTVTLGCGRTRAGRVGNGVGFNAYAIRTADAPWFESGVEVKATGGRYHLATTQHHYYMEGRDLAQEALIEEFRENPNGEHDGGDEAGHDISMYPKREYTGNAWAMVIDTNVCTGCNACVTACQAENNIPTVGKKEVQLGREMHWIRIDRYYRGGLDNPNVHHLPVLCMHCEKAPCEVVGPVAETVHGAEGLNEMVYNR